MEWFEFCTNPQSILAYYSSPPPLNPFRPLEIDLMHYSPSMILTGEMPTPPDQRFVSNDQTIRAAKITFSCFQISQLTIDGWKGNSEGILSFQHESSGATEVDYHADGVALHFVCKSIEIYALSPITDTGERARGPRLFSHPNVWNSCLLLAKQKGFSLRIVGAPDSQGSPSRCAWVATKSDGTELKGDNPIELAGLISLNEHNRPETDSDYWWRIEGESVLRELWDRWATDYYGSHRE